jgi:hypothetical protein
MAKAFELQGIIDEQSVFGTVWCDDGGQRQQDGVTMTPRRHVSLFLVEANRLVA